jgi:tRNA (cmo5U34)-methyltransferase
VGDFRDPVVAERWHAFQHAHPARVEQLKLLLTVIERASPRRVLDVGVGSGLVAEAVLDSLPEATLVGVDFSPPMLALAQPRLERFGTRAQLVTADLAEPDEIVLPPGPYDAAISVQALHNMAPRAQERALAWIGRTLAPGGLALLLDKLAIPNQLYEAYGALADLPPTAAEHEAREAEQDDWPPLLETQLAWLRGAGLEPAVLHVRANYGLIAARRKR